MRFPGLYWATFFSLLFHFAFFLISAVVLRHTSIPIDTATYVVNIVEDRSSAVKPEPEPAPTEESIAPPEPVNKSTINYATRKLKSMQDEAARKLKEMQDQKEAKEHLANRLKDMETKKRLDGIRQSAAIQADKDAASSGSEKATKILELYYAKVREKILRVWVYPDLGAIKLEAVVSITVMADGRIVTNRIERPSGNAVFDRSALRAIGKASPVDSPPYGTSLEIGVRFSPNDK